MLRFGTQSVENLVWGQHMATTLEADGSGIEQNMAIKPWLSMPGQTTGGIGFYRTETGQPLNIFASGSYLFDTYVTSYVYASGQYSFALEVHMTLGETFNLADASTQNVIYGATLAESLGLNSAGGELNSLTTALTESLSLSDTHSFNVIYGLPLEETLRVSDAILSNAALVAYVTNLNTGAVSTYRNFNFNSFAKIGEKYYGATDDGIFELAGDTDAGVAIDAVVKLGTEDFESETISAESMKRVPTAYLGVMSDGSVVLKVTANESTNIYTLNATTRTSLNTGRLMLGKGVASRYWDFEVNNVNGSDLVLESVTFYPVALTRRVVEN